MRWPSWLRSRPVEAGFEEAAKLEGVFASARGDRRTVRGFGGARAGELRPTASLAKSATAVATLRLQDQGRLSIEDRLGRWLPDAPADKAGITLHQLLTHTGGFATDVYDPVRRVTREEARALILGAPLERPPGEAYGYSSADYLLLAMVVEEAGAAPFDEQLDELFRLADMDRTGFPGPTTDTKRARRVARAVLAEPAAQGWYRRGGGGLLTTADDWLRWLVAMFEGRLLSRSALAAMTAPHAPIPGEAAHAGYGWVVETTAAGLKCRHSGHWRDNHSLAVAYPERRLAIVGFSTSAIEPFESAMAKLEQAALSSAR
jgi:CubicO group peptidase (beta-lactamase class C family)